MRSLLTLCSVLVLSHLAAGAQQPPAISAEQKRNFNQLLERARAAIEAGDVPQAERAASDLLVSPTRLRQAKAPTPRQSLQELKQLLAGKDQQGRFASLPKAAKAAVEAGELTKAEAYVHELRALAPQYPKSWNCGNAVHDGPMVLGRIALRNNDLDGVQRLLLQAGQTPGSPQLNAFGPNMSLAKDLLERSERDTVLEYFALCRGFWKFTETLDQWTAIVKGGGMPAFRANLRYRLGRSRRS